MFGIFHAFESPAEDTGEQDKVQGRHWNDVHRIGVGSLFPFAAAEINLDVIGSIGTDSYGRIETINKYGADVMIQLNMDDLPVNEDSYLRVFPMVWLDAPRMCPRLQKESEGMWVLNILGVEGDVLDAPPSDVLVRVCFYINPVYQA